MDTISTQAAGPSPGSIDLEVGLPYDTLFKFGQELLAHGATAEETEKACARVGDAYDIEGEVLATTAQLTMSFARGLRNPIFARGPVPRIHLARLEHVARSERQVTAGRYDVPTLARALEQPSAGTPVVLRRLMHPASAAAMACVLGGGWQEAAAAAVGGLGCGLLEQAGEASPVTTRMLPALASFVTFQSSFALLRAGLKMDAATASIAGAYLLLPGLTANLGLVEISQQHLQSGGARLVNAACTWGQLALGASLAGRLWQQPPVLAPAAAATLWQRPQWWVCQVAAGLTTGVAMHARPKMLIQTALGSLVGAGAWALGAAYVDDPTGCLLAGTGVVLAARAGASITGGSDWPMLYPALQLLVPGSSGLRGLLLLGRDTSQAYDVLSQATLRALYLSLGILTGQTVAHLAGTVTDACRRVLDRYRRGQPG